MNYPICLCGKNDYRCYNYIVEGRAFSVLACQQCRLARIWPPPLNYNEIVNFYKTQSGHEEKFTEIILRKKFAQLPLNILRRFCSSGLLLDVGCSVGIFVNEAKKVGFKAQGIDLSDSAIRDGQEKLNLGNSLSVGTLQSKQFPTSTFDVISYLHCLEHILDLTTELEEVERVLKPTGFLIIEVPRFFSIWRLLLGSHWYGFVDSEHIWQFGKRGVTNLLKRSGFKMISARTRLSMYHKITPDLKGLIKLFIFGVAWLTATGDNLIIVAQKK